MIIYSGPMSMFGAKVQIAALEKMTCPKVEMVPFGLRRRYDPKHPSVLRVNPKGQVPVLIDEGVELYDSTQIFEYLEDAYPEPALWPTSVRGRAAARQLEHASDEVFFPHVIKLMSARGEEREPLLGAAADYHSLIERRLQDAPFLAGDYGFADIAFFMASLFGEVVGARVDEENGALLDWRRRVAARPPVERVVGPMLRFMAERQVIPDDFGPRVLGIRHWSEDQLVGLARLL